MNTLAKVKFWNKPPSTHQKRGKKQVLTKQGVTDSDSGKRKFVSFFKDAVPLLSSSISSSSLPLSLLPLSALIGNRFHLPLILSYLRDLRSALCQRFCWSPSTTPPLWCSPPRAKALSHPLHSSLLSVTSSPSVLPLSFPPLAFSRPRPRRRDKLAACSVH